MKLLSYNAHTGIFNWKIRRAKTVANARWNPKHAGKVAGWTDSHGYTVIDVGEERFKAHRLAFMFMIGRWPTKEVDHRDLNKANNRWGNLREATRSQQLSNTKLRRNNTSGCKGVHWDAVNQKWRAMIGVGGRLINGKRHANKKAARIEYIALAKKHFGEFARP